MIRKYVTGFAGKARKSGISQKTCHNNFESQPAGLWADGYRNCSSYIPGCVLQGCRFRDSYFKQELDSRQVNRFLLLFSAASLFCADLSAESCTEQQDAVRQLRDVVVWGRRPMRDIGIQRTDMDSLALKENIAQSLADVLTYNSSVYVKSGGRATLSTVAFRGTSAAHTQVTWNGMRINNPMSGMTDFSTIPSFFVDNASLLHGSSSVNETGGGLGGLVRLSTAPVRSEGLRLQYIQGIGSFSTFDEFLRVTYGNGKWQTSTRAVCSTSPNDYKYINYDKKLNIYDENKNIIGQYYPTERNRSGSYKDFHLLEEVYFTPRQGDRLGLNAWLISSNRELPVLTTDYGDERDFDNRQRETTFRGVVSWEHRRRGWNMTVRSGYIHTHLTYEYKREVADGKWSDMTHSLSRVNTVYVQTEGEYLTHEKWMLSGNISAHEHMVHSIDRKVTLQDGDNAFVGYDKNRPELSGALSARWQPIDPIGISAVLRGEIAGRRTAPLIHALFIDGLLSRRGNVMFRSSISKNHKFPTLNDMYFLPGGNPDLRSEKGWTYDAGVSFDSDFYLKIPFSTGGGVTWFDSHIDDWILWLPTTKGFFSPRNVRKVHSYGVESKLNVSLEPIHGWILHLDGSYSWTPSVNEGSKISDADQSVGKQLPYVPRHSASLSARLSWQRWVLLYKWAYYSKRYTMSSNDVSLSDTLPEYYMSNIALERGVSAGRVDLQLKLQVNNLFNAHYLSVLSHPMPGINFEFFVSATIH